MITRTPYQLLKRWNRHLHWQLAGLCAIHLFIIFVTHEMGYIGLTLSLIIGILGVGALYYLVKRSAPGLQDAIRLAHTQNSKLDYSAQLMVEAKNLSGLALLQKRRTQTLFESVVYKIPRDISTIRKSCLLIASFLVLATSLQALLNRNDGEQKKTAMISNINDDTPTTDGISDTTIIKNIDIIETPPPYTKLKRQKHKDFNFEIAEGATVRWTAKVEGPVNSFYLKFSEGDTITLPMSLTFQKEFKKSDFYNYGFTSEHSNFSSDFHSIKVRLDQKPKVVISGIEEYVKLPWTSSHTLSFEITLSDDFGLTEAFISATIAKGSGESVKFRERKFELKNYKPGSREYQGTFSFNTQELKMKPGDELYFYIKAKDNYPSGGHWTKSITHFVSIQDTTTYEYADEGGMQVDLMPDFFRSQRQIIIDSEKLLRNKSAIAIDSFKRASNALGYDQKMLRLKYGQFLGEENESGIAINNELEEAAEDHADHDHEHDHEHEEGSTSRALESARDLLSQYMHDHDHEEEEGLLMATKGTESNQSEDPARPTWVEELSHNHDDSEVATFHDISVKSKLRAALSIMWDAELHLRLFDPATSLPFQYECLELLQEVKNHARIYVHRIGFDPPTIKESELRLSGEQDKIEDQISTSLVVSDDEYKVLKNIVEILGGQVLSDPSKGLEDHLKASITALAKISLQRPEVLPVLTSANRINQNLLNTTGEELDSLRRQIIQILPQEALPVSGAVQFAHEMTLSVAKKITF